MKLYVIKNDKRGYYSGCNKYVKNLQDVPPVFVFNGQFENALEDGDYYVQVKTLLMEVGED